MRLLILSSTISQDCTDERKVHAVRLSALNGRYATQCESKETPLENGPSRGVQKSYSGWKHRNLLVDKANDLPLKGMEWLLDCHGLVTLLSQRAEHFNIWDGRSSHGSDCKVNQLFLALMRRRGWDKLPEEVTRQMIAYSVAKKGSLVKQNIVAEIEGHVKQARMQRPKEEPGIPDMA